MLENGRPYEYVTLDENGLIIPDPDDRWVVADSEEEAGEQTMSTAESECSGWGHVASDEIQQVDSLTSKIFEAEVVGASSNSEDENDEEEEPTAREGESALVRVQRFQEQIAAPQDDPYWLGDFFNIIEKLPDVGPSLQRPVSLLSGCSGLVAEGWVCKAGRI
eukprot:Skav218630  [mRNA]  locus=scaffold365:164923:165411:+ [translate_table: standard]